MSSCVGCREYILDRTKYITIWYCDKYDLRDKYPGKGCSNFDPIEPRYKKYNHTEYCKQKGIPTE